MSEESKERFGLMTFEQSLAQYQQSRVLEQYDFLIKFYNTVRAIENINQELLKLDGDASTYGAIKDFLIAKKKELLEHNIQAEDIELDHPNIVKMFDTMTQKKVQNVRARFVELYKLQQQKEELQKGIEIYNGKIDAVADIKENLHTAVGQEAVDGSVQRVKDVMEEQKRLARRNWKLEHPLKVGENESAYWKALCPEQVGPIEDGKVAVDTGELECQTK